MIRTGNGSRHGVGARLLSVALAAALVTGCSTSWPRVTSVSNATFGAAAPVSIDVLPIDLEVWVQPGVEDSADAVRAQAESHIAAMVAESLYRHGHNLGAVLDWRGSYVAADGSEVVALEPPALLATVDSLASYGTATQVTKELPVPYLPVRLGERTGSDATLYIGGWGFVGKKSNLGNKVATAVVVAVAVVAVVALLAVLSKKSDSVGKALDGAGKGVSRAGRAMASAGRVALRAAARAGTAVVDLAKVGADVTLDVVSEVDLRLPDDAFGRDETHRNLVSGRPEWSQAPNARERGASALYLEMTLVDNATGLVRWHAHQQFPANPKNQKQVARAVASMLAAMPHELARRPMPMPPAVAPAGAPPALTAPEAAPPAPEAPGATSPEPALSPEAPGATSPAEPSLSEAPVEPSLAPPALAPGSAEPALAPPGLTAPTP